MATRNKKRFVNVYLDDDGGRFISNDDYANYLSAFKHKDDCGRYLETIQINGAVEADKLLYQIMAMDSTFLPMRLQRKILRYLQIPF